MENSQTSNITLYRGNCAASTITLQPTIADARRYRSMLPHVAEWRLAEEQQRIMNLCGILGSRDLWFGVYTCDEPLTSYASVDLTATVRDLDDYLLADLKVVKDPSAQLSLIVVPHYRAAKMQAVTALFASPLISAACKEWLLRIFSRRTFSTGSSLAFVFKDIETAGWGTSEMLKQHERTLARVLMQWASARDAEKALGEAA